MKTSSEIYNSVQKRFKHRTGDDFGIVLGLYTAAMSNEFEGIYDTIEHNKTPHIWTKLEGQDLDDTGTWVNVPRDVNESDNSYRYRLMQWTQLHEGATEKAINTALLNPKYAANIQYVPMTNGAGTGTCYVIPKEYTKENISLALNEAHEKIKLFGSATAYTEYIVPEIKAVSFEIYLETENGDQEAIKQEITAKIKNYVNSIAPGNYLSLGDINRIGVSINNVKYYNVLSCTVDGQTLGQTRVLQQIDSKFIFDNIIWIGDL